MPTVNYRDYPRTYAWNYTQVSSDVTQAVTATVAAAGSVTFLGSATRPVTATVSAAGSVILMGTATRPVSATVSAAGSVTFVGTAAASITATVSAGASLTLFGSVSRAVSAAVSAGGFTTVLGQAGVPLAAAVSAAGSVTFLGAASVPLAAAIAAAGSVTFLGSASVQATAAVAVAGTVTGPGSGTASVLITGVISAAGLVTIFGGASVPVAAAVSSAGLVTILGSASRPVTAAVAAAGSVTFLGSASRAITASVSASGSIVAMAQATVSVAVAVNATGLMLPLLLGDASLDVTAAVSATGYASGGARVISGGAMPWTFFADSAVAPFTDLGPLQVATFTCGWTLSGFGAGEATIVIGPKSALPRAMLMQLWTWRLWAFYNGVPVWAGCPTGVTDQGSQTVTVALTELPGYLGLKQYALNHVYTGVEQCTIAADLASPLSNIGVAVATSPGSGQNRDRTYTFLQSDRGQMLTDLSQVTNGPEFRSEYAMGAGGAGCTLKIAYPRVGQSSNLAVVVPHGAISFRTTWSGDMYRTRTFAVGDTPPNAPTTATKPVVTIVAPQAGVPELDHVDDWPGVSVTSTLNEYAASYSSIYNQPALALEAVMPLMSPLLGSYGVGDDVAVSLADPLVPAALNATGRLTELRLDAGSGTVTWTVAITLPRPRRYATLSAQLKALHRKTAGIFHNSMSAPPGGINP